MKKYFYNRTIGDTKHRIHVAQSACDNIYDLPEAVERAKYEVKHIEKCVPPGYIKVNEQIITTIYELPQNKIVHTTYNDLNGASQETVNNITNNKYISKNIYESKNKEINYNKSNKNIKKGNNYVVSPKMRHYCEEYDSDDGFPNKKINYVPIDGGRIDNYHETKISDDGKYIMNISIAKKVFDKNKNNQNIYQRNNYNSEVMEIDENDDNGEQNYIEEENSRYEVNNNLPINKGNNNRNYREEDYEDEDYEYYDDNDEDYYYHQKKKE